MRPRPVPRVASFLAAAAALGFVVGAWQLATMAADDPVFWPTAGAVLHHTWTAWVTAPEAWAEHVAPTLGRVVVGWSVAAVGGILIGALIGWWPAARGHVLPLVHFTRAIPPPALLPALVVALGIDDRMRLALIAIGALPPVILATARGVSTVDPLHLDVARVHRLRRRDVLRNVVAPSAAPHVLAGLRVSMGIAIILVVVSELVGASSGVGYALVQAQRGFRVLDVWAATVVLGVMGVALSTVLGAVERRVLRWQGHERGAPA